MAMKTLIATLCLIGVALAENSPVFLWGANSPAKAALQTVSQTEFADVITPLLKDHMIVAFQEENLSSNDFLCANAESAKSCYAHLQGVEHKTYYANVENPTEALRAASGEREFNSIDKSGELATPLSCAAGKIVIVSFDNAQQERGATLEAHDVAISAITKDLDCPVLYMYMSTPSSQTAVQSRKRRDTAATVGGYMFHEGYQFRIFYTHIYLNQDEIVPTAMQITNITDSVFNVTLTTATTPLQFSIILASDGYYSMVNVSYGNLVFYNTSITAPTDFSYACGNLTLTQAKPTVPADGTPQMLVISSLQFQAPFGAASNVDFIFGDSWNCVGFFTPGILSGLFVAILMLSIIFMGICWMMDINTMDRFDDQKGKTITINASE